MGKGTPFWSISVDPLGELVRYEFSEMELFLWNGEFVDGRMQAADMNGNWFINIESSGR